MGIQKINICQNGLTIDPVAASWRSYNVCLHQGAQILGVPGGSNINGITLLGGAYSKSKWAALRGAVLKFGMQRETKIVLKGHGYVIPSGHALMDEESFTYTKNNCEKQKTIIAYVPVEGLCKEKLYLVHASYCHPNELFLPQGRYTKTRFTRQVDYFGGHMNDENSILYLEEASLDEEIKNIIKPRPNINVLEMIDLEPKSIIVKLKKDENKNELGYMILSES